MNAKDTTNMSLQQRLLLETLAGHFAWLKSAHPRKANTSLAKKAQKSVRLSLRLADSDHARYRKAA